MYPRPDRLRDPAERERHEDVRLLLMVTEAQVPLGLEVPAASMAALERVAQDETETPRYQRCAATVLARVRLRAMTPRTDHLLLVVRGSGCSGAAPDRGCSQP